MFATARIATYDASLVHQRAQTLPSRLTSARARCASHAAWCAAPGLDSALRRTRWTVRLW
eukprot:388927-Prymnesium_polylepis.2